MKYFFCFIFICQFIEATENRFSEYFMTGERKTENYIGPLNSLSSFHKNKAILINHDQIFFENYLNQQIQADLFSLSSFWNDSLSDESSCPNEELQKNYSYTRYLYRLVALSYLFEAIKNNHRVSEEMNFKNSHCSIKYDELFKKCEPKSEDMKKFKLRVYGKFVNEYSKIYHHPFSSKEQQNFLNVFLQSKNTTKDVTFARVHGWCYENNKNCSLLSQNEFAQAVGEQCQRDRELFTLICNENDDAQSIQYSEFTDAILKTSNAFQLINQYGMGENCLRRFKKYAKLKENQYIDLRLIFPLVFENLKAEKSRYMQGELFLPGALKEFDQKGLSDFLTALKPPVDKKKIVKLVPKPIPVVVKEAKKEIVIEAPPIPVLEEVEAPVEIYIADFEKKWMELVEKKLERNPVNMEIFRTDYELTSKKISELAAPMRKMQSQKALKEIKALDDLGSKKAPLDLIFIKFLLDTDSHQGLYNILSVVGEKFYIFNGFEKRDDPIYIELKNDESTKNKWQISILKEPLEIKKAQ